MAAEITNKYDPDRNEVILKATGYRKNVGRYIFVSSTGDELCAISTSEGDIVRIIDEPEELHAQSTATKEESGVRHSQQDLKTGASQE